MSVKLKYFTHQTNKMKTLHIIQNIVHNRFINRIRPEIKQQINSSQLIKNKTTKNNTTENNAQNINYSYEYPYVVCIHALIKK